MILSELALPSLPVAWLRTTLKSKTSSDCKCNKCSLQVSVVSILLPTHREAHSKFHFKNDRIFQAF